MAVISSGRKKTLFTPLSFLSLCVFLFACKKNIENPAPSPASGTETLAAMNGNLIIDGNFEQWRSNAASLVNWTTVHTEAGIITKGKTTGVRFSANAAGNYYIYQRINLDARKFYKVSVTASYTLNDYSAAGIFVMDTTMKKVLGKFERVYYSDSSEDWQFIFYSRKAGTATVVIGFLNGINGTVLFNRASVQEFVYEPRISVSPFSFHLQQTLNLTFLPATFDSSLSHIGDYVNKVLLAGAKIPDDTAESSFLDQTIGTDSNYTFFNQYRHAPEQVENGYCQRSSLSLGEILKNEFNIPVRQMYMQFSGVGKHQFLEYWNPFSRRWIIIDPCFSVRYVKNGRLLGDEEFTPAEAPGLMVRFGSHRFYAEVGELVELWHGMDELVVSDYFTLTFPFANVEE